MTLFCGSCIVGTFASGVTTAPLQEAAGLIVVPFEKRIANISSYLEGVRENFREKRRTCGRKSGASRTD